MAKYYVVVEELTANTYEVEADTAEEAEEHWIDGDCVFSKGLQEDVVDVREEI